MKTAIIGGGPAGLYFAILLKKLRPDSDITVYERNRADETFGFGVVFSDATLDNFEKYDLPSYQRITREFAYWDDIAIHFKGTVHRIGGNGFCGCSRRTLLLILQDRAEELGVKLRYEVDVDDESLFADADLVVVADGINSRFRDRYADHFQPEVDLRPNKFAWMGSTRPLDAFTFIFQETEWGPFIAHAYQYEANRSTWVFETDPETFERAGLKDKSEAESAALMEQIFGWFLDGHRVLTNRSIWRNFPMIRNKRWVMGNKVLLGDAKASAHFSIGSGTKLAMEDAIALYEAFRREPSVEGALALYETGRREEVEKTQHAADVSLVWFEHVARFWDFDPVQFAFGVMTRAKAITYDNLRLRAPDFVAAVDKTFAKQVRRKGFDVPVDRPAVPMFQPFRLRDMIVPNRVVVSPMDMYSAKDGVPGDFHLVHYGSRAMGGAGLVFTEMTCVSPEARITLGCTGLWNDEQEEAWRRIVDFVHANSATKICLQLGHAGRKGATKLMWEGIDRPLEEGAWDICSASPIPYFPDSQVPREATRADMDRIKQRFVEAAIRGERAGFDMLELHCAHGYLLASFISPLTNRRTDEYGGSLENRLRYPLEVFDAMREVWPAHKPMSVRISATDWAEGGVAGEDAVEIARAFAEHGVDLVDVSTGQTVREARPVYGRMFQTPFSDQVRNEAHVATMCVGNITTADQVNTILAAGRADLVALGRPHLVDPFFTMKAAAWYGAADIHCPPQYYAGRDQIFRNSVRDRQDLEELKIKAKPKTRAELKMEAGEKPLAAE
ncbi:bifunctional salicylyl-CoA 5-hydroxylase/oxidoreductase [Microvirga arsenatis]|uniref:Bifunctional salicylyl-CoA 5-hydroxylase/oxidoreductase n=1 Tax=Microvirga arsenatis TaxID=2692265 RepID=A0ABW9Z0S7_9HYPH|nr:bifunctional salicylyl-CoA 5-hydroxylase/oxidoreductase [Microvirga arsenatis]NBJ10843.1 bifunctional salicylyl-CoA 5-hydroxylase/oxidoreductase [Microvirga arsenatis]NBJ24259.1 bifunctional salicylyl-CoA 5-hydroxylase/oxidoreductase [Microvirga arsenatis]